MKLTILKNHLNEAIQHVARAVSSKTSIPILAGIKIEARPDGVTLTGSDTDISIQSFIAAEKEDLSVIQLMQQGSVVLPSKYFTEIVKKLPAETVEIEVNDLLHTTIRSGSSEIQLMGLDPEEYPLLPTVEENQVITLSGAVLSDLIRKTVFAVSTQESSPILTGVLCSLSEGNMKFIGCDRHRLASRTAILEQVHPELQFDNIVIPGKTMNELYKLIPDDDILIDIVVANNQVLFKLDNILFYSRILDGTYPDTTKIIPQQFQTEIKLNTKALNDAIDRAHLFSREDKSNIVRFVLREDHIVEISSSSSESGKMNEEIQALGVQGQPLKISFNCKYMLDALKVMDCQEICISFSGAMHPIILTPVDEQHVLQLILPYRTVN